LTEHTQPDGAPGPERLEESLEDLYERAPCGYISMLPDGSFAKVNQTFLDWTGYQREELLAGKRFQDLLAIAGRIFYETHFAPLLHMQSFVNEIAFDLLCSNGKRLPVLVSATQKQDASGAPLLHRAAIFRAADRRQYERELQLARTKAEDALALRDQFLSVASHELKTPLTSILGHIDLLQRRVRKERSLNERDQRSLQIIADQTRRLHKMIVSLLDISRIETGQLSIDCAPINMCALVGRVVDEMQVTLAERRIEMHCSDQLLIIEGDALRLEQVFQNLIQNALKYSSHTAPIVVAVRQHEASVCIDVRDTGIGIPPASAPRLFERFYRADNVDQEHVSGLGIGLYVVKEIISLHGGAITVESVEGKGSTFTVCLPLSVAPAQHT
jgi:PAS domain S-box-containing protein